MLGNQIRSFRLNSGFSQVEMAKMLNISQVTFCRYETGDREPNVDTIRKLCIIFNCTSDELLEIDSDNVRKEISKKLLKNNKT